MLHHSNTDKRESVHLSLKLAEHQLGLDKGLCKQYS